MSLSFFVSYSFIFLLFLSLKATLGNAPFRDKE